MFFAGFSGATAFFPDAVFETGYAPQIVITEFRLFRSAQANSNQSAPSPVISYASKITIPHSQNMFSLTFAALAYSNPRSNRYRYMLECLDNSWNEVGSDGRTVTYTGLSAGTYRFRVQGATVSSQWSVPGAELQIVILPPWWKTCWFIALCTSATLLLVWLIYRYRMQQIAKQFEIRLEAGVDERTRIARELHDTLLQSFQGLTLHFQRARNLLPGRTLEAIRTLDAALDGAEDAIVEGRDAIHDLRSPTTASKALNEEIRALGEELVAEGIDRNGPVDFRILIEGSAHALRPNLHTEIFRIVREALRNAFSHSQGHLIETELAYTESLFRLRIRDDGRGIDSEERLQAERTGHWGLRGMRERAEHFGGELEVWSEPGAGTEIELRIPATVAYETVSSRNSIWLFSKPRKDR
jgi:signal transduction histidine kinase